MAITRQHTRPPFDPDRNFVVLRPLLVSSKSFSPGDLFEPTLVNTRRLKLLYEQRIIKFGADDEGGTKRKKKKSRSLAMGPVDDRLGARPGAVRSLSRVKLTRHDRQPQGAAVAS